MAALFIISLVVLLASWGTAVYVASEIGYPKGRAGIAWGIIFGWFGVFIVYVLPPKES